MHPELGSYGIEWRWTDRQLYRKYSYFATGLRRWSEQFTADYILMADADTLILGDISDAVARLTSEKSVAGVIATFPPFMARGDGNTDMIRWHELFSAAGLGAPPMIWHHPGFGHMYTEDAGIQRAPPYFNFGFVIGTRAAMNAIAATFEADYLCALGYMKTDLSAQAGLALSIVRTGTEAHELPVRFNFWSCSEYCDAFPEDFADIRLLHYLHLECFDKARDIGSPERLAARVNIMPELGTPIARRLSAAFEAILPQLFQDLGSTAQLPVARPLLPVSDEIMPMLRRIDDMRIYSNFGPLNAELELRLAARAQLPPEHCVTAANATLVLTAALQALARPGRSQCLMPSWTFCATAHAAKLAGLEPCFADVRLENWQLMPDIVEAALAQFGDVAAVVAVAPFGQPVDLQSWHSFQERTGIPVIIDAAAAFDAQQYGSVPVVVSLHPTKSLAAGEGGFLIADNPHIIDAVRARLNFGFPKARVAKTNGLNGKMTEYAAAIALAALERWPATREAWRERHNWYMHYLTPISEITPFGNGAVSSTFVVTAPARDHVAQAMMRRNLDTRLWWNLGCHAEPAFVECSRTKLPNTEQIADRYLGLPLAVDMHVSDVLRVTDVISGVFHS